MQLVRELKSHKYREGPGGEVLTTRAVEIILEYLDTINIRKIKCICAPHVEIRCRQIALQKIEEYSRKHRPSKYGRGITSYRRAYMRKERKQIA